MIPPAPPGPPAATGLLDDGYPVPALGSGR